jgi:hypothetical protein
MPGRNARRADPDVKVSIVESLDMIERPTSPKRWIRRRRRSAGRSGREHSGEILKEMEPAERQEVTQLLNSTSTQRRPQRHRVAVPESGVVDDAIEALKTRRQPKRSRPSI